MRISVLSTFLLLFTSSAFAQLDVSMECVVVNTAGNAQVSWTESTDVAGIFDAYEVHVFEPSSGLVLNTFTIADQTTPSFVNSAFDANLGELCYFVIVAGTDGSMTAPSDTICSIHLTASPGMMPSEADLNWNSPRIANGGPLGPDLTVQKIDTPGNWLDVATVSDNGGMMSYTYTVEECSEDLTFRIVQPELVSGCNHVSNQDGSEINDELDPDPPIIYTIDVNPFTQWATLNWTPSAQSDLAGYIVYICNGGFQTAIDTIFDPTATSYVNPFSNADAYIESYNIAAFDSCFVGGEPDPGAASAYCATTMFLDISREPCSNEAQLTWYGGYNWDGTLVAYDVTIDEESPAGSGNWTFGAITETLPAEADTYLHTDAVYGNRYRYHVMGQMTTGAEGGTNIRMLEYSYPGAPSYTEIRRVSVLDDGAIEIIVDTDPEATEPHVYTIERLDPGDTVFEPIAAQTATNGLTLNFVDSAVHSDEASYIYRVEVSNECGDIVGTSQEAQNILLVGLIDSQLLENTLFWTAYDEFPSAGPTPGGYSTGVAGYRVYRSLQSTGSLELIASLSAGSSHFEDDVSQMLYTPGEFCYLIEAIDLESGPMGSANYALSNSFCLTQEPVIWVPNAIMAHGENNIFMPVVSFADIDSYVLEVFSRWGDVMFHSDALGHGWDGMYRGTLAPEGSYGYTLSIQDGAGKIFNRSGMLHLLIGGE